MAFFNVAISLKKSHNSEAYKIYKAKAARYTGASI